MNLVFDGRAVARAHTFDHTGVHRRAIEVGGDDFVGSRVGVGDPAADLRRMLLTTAHERHYRQRGIAWLFGHQRKVHGPAIDARRGSGLQASNTQR
jgi:hypothetical protein